mmetsp:Transcript_44902/g.54389  ORF Transcript_44902/g.54389 Transcript_44902/m.54389 type:complete len:342 (+) Transcript_44902:118-1143(+)
MNQYLIRNMQRFRLRALFNDYLKVTARSQSSLSDNPTIGFVGLGNMGLPMCLNLLDKFPKSNILAHDLSSDTVAVAVKNGARPVASPVAMLNSSNDGDLPPPDFIITMLPGCSAVRSVYSELLSAMSPTSKETILIDCSTVSPLTSKELHNKVASMSPPHKLSMLDAPVSGGVNGAKNATLTFMVGGSDATFTAANPLLAAMGANVIHCGGPSTGAAVKVCNNLALASQMIGIAEAMTLGESLGVDVTTLRNVMNRSTAGCWSCEVNNPHPEVGAVAKSGYKGGFGTMLMLKDLGLAIGAAEEKGVALPIGSLSKELYKLCDKQGMGGKDFGVVFELLKGK